MALRYKTVLCLYSHNSTPGILLAMNEASQDYRISGTFAPTDSIVL